MMFILTALLWAMSLVLFLTYPENEKTRWGSFIGFFGGFGGLSVILSYYLDGSSSYLQLIHYITSSLGHYGTAYAIMIFGLVFSEIIKNKKRSFIWKIILFIPVIIMQIYFTEFPQWQTHHVFLSLWVVPYVFISIGLMVYAAYTEKSITSKRQKVYTCLVVVPTLLFAVFTNIILEAFGIFGVWMLNPWVIAIAFVLFVYFIIKYGFLGVQVKFEKQRRDFTMKAVTSGTALLNHSIKNEVAKIDLLANDLKGSKIGENQESVDMILKSANHLFELSSRIQSKLDIMELKETEFNIIDLVNSSVELLQPQISTVQLKKLFEVDANIYADPIHLQETLLNLMKNAMEAMGNNKQIKIRVYQLRRKLHIDVADNGKGVNKEMQAKMLDPFFSTKKKVGNFGLGLTYCYNVMTKHNGSIKVNSQLGEGTTITLTIPRNRVINLKSSSNSKKEIVGESYG